MSAVLQHRRTVIEDYILMPSAVKIGVALLTFLSDLTKNYTIEETIGAVSSVFGLVFSTCGWWYTSVRLRRLGFALIICALYTPLLLGPSNPQPAHLVAVRPYFSKLAPPRFPSNGFVSRNDIMSNGTDGWFREKQGPHRVVTLRGINFGASTKIPSSNHATHLKRGDFYSGHEHVSFVSRPCPLDQADEHFSRLAAWGFNIVRLLITWEAVEHGGPGKYDHEYLEYLRKLCQKAASHGISVFVDPHQDVWSRFTGGDGAPGWTLDKVGFKLGSELFETGAALTHQEFGDPFPRMSWPTNYGRLACATMFTLFFAGNDFAPKTFIDGVPVQEYLQGHYANAMKQVAKALKNEQNVLGFDTLNEPSNGYVGLDDLRKAIFPVPLAHHMSAFDGMVLGAGFSRKVDLFSAPFIFNHTELMNPRRIAVWKSAEHDVWKQNGVWDLTADSQPRLLRPGHFNLPKTPDNNGSFIHTYMIPFFQRVAKAIRVEVPDMIIFAEPHIEPKSPVHHHAPSTELIQSMGGSWAWAPHYYDAATLVTKTFRPWYALDAEKGSIVLGTWFANGVFQRAAQGLRKCGEGLPVLVGETGVPFDFQRTDFKEFSLQTQALNRVLSAMEREFLSWTLWTYTPDNTNARGDLWNGEDLSLWSRDQVTDPNNLNSGGRGLEAAVRPYAMKIAGEPLETSFDPYSKGKRFYLKMRVSLKAAKTQGLETVLFIPLIQYPKGIQWRVGGKGSSMLKSLDVNEQGYLWKHDVGAAAGKATSGGDGEDEYVEQWVEIEAKI